MNVLFLTLGRMGNIETKGAIYTDLVRKLRDEGHSVYVVHALEKRHQKPTVFETVDGVHFLRIRTGNITKTSKLEKGLSTILLESLFISGIKNYLSDITFDLVLYSTPPITFAKVINYVKRRDKAKTYLLLKDIFPQNAIDLNYFSKYSLIYSYFRQKEKKLYASSDVIGCMSPANVSFLNSHNQLAKAIVEVNPNSIEVGPKPKLIIDEKQALKKTFGLPHNQTIFLYGGNIGKPQGITFFKKVLLKNEESPGNHFVIAGSGTEFNDLKTFIAENDLKQTTLFDYLPKEEYDQLVKIADVGLILLDHRFTIPNYPSRLLAYLQHALPVLAATDVNSDIKDTIAEGQFGYWAPSDDVDAFMENMTKFQDEANNQEMGDRGYDYLLKHFTVERTYYEIIKHFEREK
ncbi:glycosyltransferase family 4 protein [Streptococcus sp. ZJ151]|uniref:glycosyltransferase family 4 protein n=1 Tax=Streptococcus jiangjianxini TaxID=3161189 RepID=UPI0032EE0C9A